MYPFVLYVIFLFKFFDYALVALVYPHAFSVAVFPLLVVSETKDIHVPGVNC